MRATTPTTSVVIKGHTYDLCFDFDAIEYAEQLTQRSLLSDGFTKAELESPKAALVRSMFAAAVRKNHPKMSVAEAKALVSVKNYYNVWVEVVKAWVNCLNEPDEDAEPGEAVGQS